ncbi:OsmC family protein [Shewanella sp. SR43-4]|uniref:OsmC family protein n=1 Tax=Shewanella TaxID=22 RepID=UPI000C65A98B|nr:MULTISPECIES: OsmC family protein [Shewanella]NCQ45618.1 OsmC family peroxiredoxin [Shewanella frigidimarina]MBB1318059.1 OsmC family protein [Shewanella sp. SR43-4]MBB1320265.1 OsmC family protein [Shewanella sp. SR43-8]MBB1389321.1 OsmC family protein [Shewanella sp. SG44-6]MBB1474713.1 OsmC family protein [Shewanella sp. SG41-3]
MGFKLTVNWQSSPSEEGEFNRDHEVKFGTGQSIQASSAPEYKGNADKVNPEESLLAALSSCHMLTFLAIAHLKRLPVASYVDNATADLGKNEAGKVAVVKMTLAPKVTFAQGVDVDEETLAKIHEKAHANCFIANSLACEVEIKH